MPRQKKLRTLNDILVLAKALARRRTLALAGADQEEGLKSVNEGRRHGFIEPLLIGDKQRIVRLCRSLKIPFAGVTIVDEPDPKHGRAEGCRGLPRRAGRRADEGERQHRRDPAGDARPRRGFNARRIA